MGLHFTGEVQETAFALIEPGYYAVTMSAEFKKTKGGSDFINCAFKIMKEYDNTWGGRIVFDGLYKSTQSGEFQRAKIDAILATIKNFKNDFEDYEELVQYINGTEMIVYIDIEKADENVPTSKDRNVIRYLSYKSLEDNLGLIKKQEKAETKVTTKVETAKEETKKDEIDEPDELPF